MVTSPKLAAAAEAAYKNIIGGDDDHKKVFNRGFELGAAYRDQNPSPEVMALVEALKRVNHAVANAWEWQCSDPEDSEMDRDQQIGNWCEKACDEIKEALSAFHQSTGNSGGEG